MQEPYAESVGINGGVRDRKQPCVFIHHLVDRVHTAAEAPV